MILFARLDNYWASYLPYAFLFMGYHLKKRNIEYRILHNCYAHNFERDKKDFLKTIENLKPEIIGL